MFHNSENSIGFNINLLTTKNDTQQYKNIILRQFEFR